MNALELLKEGRNLLAEPTRWTKGALARDKNGAYTDDPYTDEAVCFCTVGGVHRIGGRETPIEIKGMALTILRTAAMTLYGTAIGPIHVFNDAKDTTHIKIMAVWDKAIELARQAHA